MSNYLWQSSLEFCNLCPRRIYLQECIFSRFFLFFEVIPTLLNFSYNNILNLIQKLGNK